MTDARRQAQRREREARAILDSAVLGFRAVGSDAAWRRYLAKQSVYVAAVRYRARLTERERQEKAR